MLPLKFTQFHPAFQDFSKSSKEDFLEGTLESGINVRSGIRVLVGSFRENNKHKVWNKHIKGKF